MTVRSRAALSALTLAAAATMSQASTIDKVTHYNGGDQIWIKASSFDGRSETLSPGTPDFKLDTDASVAAHTLSGSDYYFPSTGSSNADQWWAEYSINPAAVPSVNLSGTWGFYAHVWQPAQDPPTNDHFTDSDYLFVKGDPNDGTGANWYTNAMANRSQPGDLVETGGDRVLNDIFYRINNGSDFQWISTSAFGNFPGEPGGQYDVLINKTFNPNEDAGKITFRINKREFGAWNARIDYIVFSNTPNFNSDFGEWGKTGGGTWNSAGNWTQGQQPLNAANLLGGITADSTINVDNPSTVGGLLFDNVHKYTIGGVSPLAIYSGKTTVDSSVETDSGDHAITTSLLVQSNTTFNIKSGTSLTISGGLTNSGPLPNQQTGNGLFVQGGRTIIKTGAGTLSIGGTQSWATGSVLNVQGGTLNLNGDIGSTDVTVTTPGPVESPGIGAAAGPNATTVNFGSSQHLKSLTITDSNAAITQGGSKILVTNALTLNGTAAVNVKDNDMLILGGLLPAIQKAVATGAIFTDSIVAGKATGVGYAGGGEAAVAGLNGVFDGEAFGANDVLVKYTYVGDSNLDGSVDGSDVALWAQNFSGALGLNPPNPRTWAQGDWNNDGSVDGSDVALWAQNFTGALGGGGLGEAFAAAGPAVAVEVPEPASLSLLALGATALLARRRRH